MSDLRTISPDELPVLSELPEDARAVVFSPNGPLQAVPFDQLLSRLIAADLAKATKAALDADLAHAADSVALVFNDPTLSLNGWYRKLGEVDAGSWTQFEELARNVRIAAQNFADNAADSVSQANALLADTTLALGKYVDQEVVVEPGFYDKDTGAAADPPTFAAWQRWQLAVQPGQKLSIGSLQNNPAMAVVSFFDASGNLVGAPIGTGPSSGFVRYDDLEVTVPANAVLAKGSGWSFDSFEGGFKSAQITVARISLNDEIAGEVARALAGRPWVRKAWLPASGYYNSNGALVTAGVDNAWQQQVFEIQPEQALRVENAVTNGSVTRAIVWGSGYNSGTGAFANVLGVAGAGVDGASIPLQPDVYIAPSGTTHVAVTTLGIRDVRVLVTEHSPATVRANSDTINLLNLSYSPALA